MSRSRRPNCRLGGGCRCCGWRTSYRVLAIRERIAEREVDAEVAAYDARGADAEAAIPARYWERLEALLTTLRPIDEAPGDGPDLPY